VMRLVLDKDELLQICQRMSEKAEANKMYCPNLVCSHLMNLDQLLEERMVLAQEEQLGRRLYAVSNKCLLLDSLFFQELTVPLELTGRTKLQL